ncbi:extracellular solute-binding protein [Ruania alkalisoli]|uniref:Extracellular solute-binding protein n=1 Tax=Ruania alkalisoli TaxID=2779775 RepID=A0A7M1STU5_9MICO|nr:extracellular solute-binding protein [Ruania alkalisoli]QOR70891.1 extracellular solute-binding protein [Ruania alkalisoli]
MAVHSSHASRRWLGIGIAALASLGLVACSSSDPGGAAPGDGGDEGGVTTVTLWAWYPEVQQVVDVFNENHDDVQVDLVNAGVGEDAYAKLRTALESGTGAPDVIQMELSELPSFQVMDGLLDIAPHGANDVAGDYPDWVWEQVSQDGAVYAIPVDAGPIASMYRADLYDEYGLEPAQTWDEYRANAQALQAADPDLYISAFQIGNASNLVGLIQQAGGEPYGYDFENPEDVTIDFDNEITRRVLNYWGDLIDEGLVAAQPYHSTEWDNGIATGAYLTTIEAAWRPGYLSNVADSTAGQWRVAPIPQWEEGDDLQGNHGGSTFAVTSQTDSPEASAQVAIEIFGSDEPWEVGIEEAFLFPVYNPVAQSEEFLERPYEFFGGESANEVFVPAAQSVSPLEFTPFDSFAKSTINEQVAAAIAGEQTMDEAAAEIQRILVEYAQSVGMTVTEP